MVTTPWEAWNFSVFEATLEYILEWSSGKLVCLSLFHVTAVPSYMAVLMDRSLLQITVKHDIILSFLLCWFLDSSLVIGCDICVYMCVWLGMNFDLSSLLSKLINFKFPTVRIITFSFLTKILHSIQGTNSYFAYYLLPKVQTYGQQLAKDMLYIYPIVLSLSQLFWGLSPSQWRSITEDQHAS